MFEQLGMNLLGDVGAGLVGKLFGDNDFAQRQANSINIEMQREFALNGLGWRVDDAKRNGIHPLAALGAAPGASFSPIPIPGGGGSDFDFSGTRQALRDMGQNTTRAEAATQTVEQRELGNLAIERARRENQLLDAQIAATWASFLGQPGTPPMPGPLSSTVGAPASSSGPFRSPAGLVKPKPSESVSAMPGDVGLEAAATPALKRFDVSPNVRIDLPGQQMAESLESLGPLASPAFGVLSAARAADHVWNGSGKPSDKLLPAGYRWQWSKLRQAWTAEKIPSVHPRQRR